jgi:hypothetical protein
MFLSELIEQLQYLADKYDEDPKVHLVMEHPGNGEYNVQHVIDGRDLDGLPRIVLLWQLGDIALRSWHLREETPDVEDEG